MKTKLALSAAVILLVPGIAASQPASPSPTDTQATTSAAPSSTPTDATPPAQSPDPCAATESSGTSAKGKNSGKGNMTAQAKPQSISGITKDSGDEAPAAKTPKSKSSSTCDT